MGRKGKNGREAQAALFVQTEHGAIPAPAANGEPTAPAEATETSEAPATKEVDVTTKQTTARATEAETAKAAAAPAKKGLRRAQVRILAALVRAGQSLTRKEIAAAAPCDLANCVELIGSHDEAKRLANDEKHFPCLLTLGFVKATQAKDDEDRAAIVYGITAAGEKALGKATKEDADK